MDLITNSSSETFINASDKATRTIKDLIEALLRTAKVETSASDIFDIEVVYRYSDKDYNEVWLTKAEAKPLLKDGTLPEDENEPDGNKYDGYYGESRIRVKVKELYKQSGHPGVADLEKVAKILSSLEDLFDYESTYNG